MVKLQRRYSRGSRVDLALYLFVLVDVTSQDLFFPNLMYFLTLGTKQDRSVHALNKMGPAVLNGGISTFLSFILLATSTSHVFATFFKVYV